jgi:hypothetical protein
MKSTHSITTLPDSPDQDRRHRLNRYVWQMGFRVLCFVAAVLIGTVWHSWLFVVPIVLAGVIPWVAVVIANAGNHRGDDLVRPGGAVQRYDLADVEAREHQEEQRAQAYRDEQDRLRRNAEQAQSEWQRSGDHHNVWGRR